MKETICSLFAGLLLCASAGADGCEEMLKSKDFPVKFKTTGKPRRVRWDQLDKVMSELRELAAGHGCHVEFSDLFRTDEEALFVPVTHPLLKTAPENALAGLDVYSPEGTRVGQFETRVTYQRSGGLHALNSYTLYYFQFRDGEGNLQSAQTRLGNDHFLVKWSDLRHRAAVAEAELQADE